MIFIVLMALGALGVVGTLWMSSASVRAKTSPVAKGSEWFALSPDRIEAGISNAVRTRFRDVLKVVLVWAIRQYRGTTQKIALKRVIKQKVREFLYDHAKDVQRTPSAVWNKLSHGGKSPAERKSRNEDESI